MFPETFIDYLRNLLQPVIFVSVIIDRRKYYKRICKDLTRAKVNVFENLCTTVDQHGRKAENLLKTLHYACARAYQDNLPAVCMDSFII